MTKYTNNEAAELVKANGLCLTLLNEIPWNEFADGETALLWYRAAFALHELKNHLNHKSIEGIDA